ncbi:unnamed protein product [Paramecium sonneborni]|uniref:Aminotransferase class V domain-containing protein n=1 Tax=Paramecium sonneborni TaxID=65129 RepID=A0A8S1RRH8_9CILI|nr:unnamed protein product [Paramecium sonneborni]
MSYLQEQGINQKRYEFRAKSENIYRNKSINIMNKQLEKEKTFKLVQQQNQIELQQKLQKLNEKWQTQQNQGPQKLINQYNLIFHYQNRKLHKEIKDYKIKYFESKQFGNTKKRIKVIEGMERQKRDLLFILEQDKVSFTNTSEMKYLYSTPKQQQSKFNNSNICIVKPIHLDGKLKKALEKQDLNNIIQQLFTSRATESNNAELNGLYGFYGKSKNHIITTQTEQKCVLDTCRYEEDKGVEVTYMPVNFKSLISLKQLQESIQSNALCASVMLVNNEIGVIQNLKEISRMCHERGVYVHSDLHKLQQRYLLMFKIQIQIQVQINFFHYFLQFQNIIYSCVVFQLINSIVQKELEHYMLVENLELDCNKQYMEQVKKEDQEQVLKNHIYVLDLLKQLKQRSMNYLTTFSMLKNYIINQQIYFKRILFEFFNSLFSFKRIITLKFQQNQIRIIKDQLKNQIFNQVQGNKRKDFLNSNQASSGSTCASASLEPFYILRALDVQEDMAHTSLRIGIGRFTTEAEKKKVDFFLNQLRQVVRKLREISPLWEMHQDRIDINKIKCTQPH